MDARLAIVMIWTMIRFVPFTIVVAVLLVAGIWFLTRHGKPQTAWQLTARPLILDLDHNSLGGIRLGDPVSAVGAMPGSDGAWRDDAQGVEIDYSPTGINCVLVRWDDPTTSHSPYRGEVHFQGKHIPLSDGTTIEQFMAVFGDPWWRDDDEQESLLFYEWGEVEWQVEFSRRGGLRLLLINTPPLMADPAQRAAYGVTKPWPAER